MGYWGEMRCDAQAGPRCLSALNEGPMVHMDAGAGRVLGSALRRRALEAGWTFTRQDGVPLVLCPWCAQQRKEAGLQEATP
jgi:hypothetical protein